MSYLLIYKRYLNVVDVLVQTQILAGSMDGADNSDRDGVFKLQRATHGNHPFSRPDSIGPP